ncbi:MAG: MFS transporter [Fusobacteriaceae bacterium]
MSNCFSNYLRGAKVSNMIPVYKSSFFSDVGTLAMNMALALFVLQMTGSSAALGITLLLSTIPYFLLSLFSGVISDNFNIKKIIIFCDVARLILILLFLLIILLFTFFYEQTSLVLFSINVLVTLISFFEVFQTNAYISILPSLTKKDEIIDVNTTLTILMELARIIGPLTGAVLYNYLGIEGVSLLVTILISLSIISGKKIESVNIVINKNKKNFLKILGNEMQGFKELIAFDVRVTSLYINGFATHLFLLPFIAIGMPYLLVVVLQGSSNEFGFIETIISIAGIVSLAFVPPFKKWGVSKNIFIGIIGMSVGAVLFVGLLSLGFINILIVNPMARIIYFSFCVFIIYFSFGYYGVYFSTFLQKNIPSQYIGKGMSLVMMFNSLGRIIGYSLYGILFGLPLIFPVSCLLLGMILKILIHFPFMKKEKEIGNHGKFN